MRKLYTTSFFLFFFGLFSSWNSFGQTVSISNTQAVEGNVAVFTVSLSGASTSDTVITLTTSNGTASVSDYTTIAQTVIIPAGQTLLTVSVNIVNDVLSCESTETFFLNGIVTSGNTSNTTVSGICSILDNDGAPSIVINDVTVTEGTNAVFTIMLSNPCAAPTVINVSTANGTAIAPSDYTALTTTVTIPAGSISINVTVSTFEDTIDEPAETFTLNGIVTSGNTSNSTASGIGTIFDNDPTPVLTINDVTVTEGNNAFFTLSLSNPSSAVTTVSLYTVNGTAIAPGDYTALASTDFTIPAGSTSRTVSIPTIADVLTVTEPTETFTLEGVVTSTNNSNTTVSGTGTILEQPSQSGINAVTETTPSTNGNTGGATVPLTANDTLNGNPVTVGTAPGNVTITVGAIQGGLSMNPSTGVVIVPPNTPAGSYNVTYTICEVSNPSNCDTVASVIVVSAATIDAVTETTPSINGNTGGSTAPLTNNDTLNGVPLTIGSAPGDVTITVGAIQGGLSMNPSTGVVIVPPNTPAGSYNVTYTICEVSNPSNCDTVTSVVIVVNSASDINAVSETIQMNCTGSASGSIVSVIANDTLNGVPVTLGTNGNVTLTTGPLPAGISVDSFTGVITVVTNMQAGGYPIFYTICEIANPNNCDTVTSNLIISACAIDAVIDIFNIQSGGFAPSLIANDTLNGIPVVIGTNPGQVTLTSTPTGQLSINPTTGLITVAPNTPSGNYPITYTICEVTNPTNCDTVTSIVNVTSNLGVTLTGTYSDYNNDGFTNVGDVINYQVTVSNSGSQPITNITYAQGNATINGGPIASLAGGATDTTTFTGVYVLTQNNINSGVVSIDACFYADNSISQCGTTTTTLNLSNGIRLNAFIDSNSNGIQNSGEPNISSGNFNYTINGGAINNVISSNGVLYLYESNPTTVYNLSYVISGNYSCSTTYSNITVAAGSGISTYNFPVTVTPYTDLAVYFYPSGAPRPGFSYTTRIYYRNNGNQTIASGTITYTKDNALTISSVSPSATTSTSTGFTYNFTNLLPNESRYIWVYQLVPTIPTVSLGQMVTSSVAASIPAGDGNIANNTSSYSQPIVGSYDPNDKSESHGGKILHSTFTSNDYLTYTINFENTGTAEAINIRVNDILDAKLDETSIKMVAASSGYTLQRVGSTLTWKFDGINLPPSNGSATVGHGQIVFQIKPKAGYAVGDIIPNFANIYFDFNPAIVTNVWNTEFVNSLSNSNFTFNDFKVYPNPTKNNLTISNEFAIDEVEITSILGQKMITKKVNDLQTTIDTSALSNGIYFVKVSSQGNEKTVKIVKE